jgi:hypothetical protein
VDTFVSTSATNIEHTTDIAEAAVTITDDGGLVGIVTTADGLPHPMISNSNQRRAGSTLTPLSICSEAKLQTSSIEFQ